MAYNVTIGTENDISVSVSQVGQQGVKGDTGALQTDTVTGDLYVTGDLGVGNSSPGSPLTVTSNAAGTADAIELENFAGDSSYIKAKRSITISADYDNNSSPLQSEIRFDTDGSERLIIDSDGNVGIGTNSPSAKLDVSGTINTTGNISIEKSAPVISLQDTGGTAGFQTVWLANDANSFQILTRDDSGTFISADYFIGRDVNGANLHRWDTQGSEKMRMTSAGRVGINTTAPNYKLDVNGSFGFTPSSSVTPVSNGDVVFELTNNTTLTIKAKGSDGVVRSGTVTLA